MLLLHNQFHPDWHTKKTHTHKPMMNNLTDIRPDNDCQTKFNAHSVKEMTVLPSMYFSCVCICFCIRLRDERKRKKENYIKIDWLKDDAGLIQAFTAAPEAYGNTLLHAETQFLFGMPSLWQESMKICQCQNQLHF